MKRAPREIGATYAEYVLALALLVFVFAVGATVLNSAFRARATKSMGTVGSLAPCGVHITSGAESGHASVEDPCL